MTKGNIIAQIQIWEHCTVNNTSSRPVLESITQDTEHLSKRGRYFPMKCLRKNNETFFDITLPH